MKLITAQPNEVDEEDFAAWASYGAGHPHEAVDRLIRALAKTRSTLDPAFPEGLPVFIKDSPQVDAPGWQWTMGADGSLVVNLRHPGLGWLGFRMPDVDLFHENLRNVVAERDALLAELKPPTD